VDAPSYILLTLRAEKVAAEGLRDCLMRYSFGDFCADCAAHADAGAEGRETIRQCVERLLAQTDFIAERFGPTAAEGIDVVYEDGASGLQVLTHVYATGKESPPHDHGESWAVYGQAVAHTDMTVWRRSDDGTKTGHAKVEPARTYRLDPPMAGTFEPGEIHSIRFPAGARFLRVTGKDLKQIATRRYDVTNEAVIEDAGVSGVVRDTPAS